MQLLSILPVTIASILGSNMSVQQIQEQAMIETQIRPEISGTWELDISDLQVDFLFDESTGANRIIDRYSNSKLPETISKQTLTITSSTTVLTTSDQTDNKSTKACKERYNFKANNEIKTVSGAEWTTGVYFYQHTEEGLPVLTISTIYDNNEVDCSGNQIDQTGETLMTFVDYQANKNIMRWCSDNQGKECHMTFNKLLP